MKKVLLFLAATVVMTAGYAQKKNIQSANNSLKFKEYAEAVKFIEEAVKDPSTKDDPKAWLVRGSVYLAMDRDPGYADKGYYKEVITSYKKVAELKPGYEGQAISEGLIYSAYRAYNESLKNFNAKQYDQSFDYAQMVMNVHDMDSKVVTPNKPFDTIATSALLIQAYSAFNNEKPDVALPLLLKLKDNPIESSSNVYLIIASVYEKKGQDAKELAIIEEARKKFPNDAEVRNRELNYYIRTGQQDALIKKLEGAVAADPNNASYQFNLANAYTNQAMPKDGPKPSNYDELIAKAEAGYKKAIELNPDNVDYNYDLGALYFNKGARVAEQMNELGTTPEEDKKYEELKKVKDGLYDNALLYLEKVYKAYDPKAGKLTADENFIYRSTLNAMKEIYFKKEMKDKYELMKSKLEASGQ